jgi:uracil-DNA glycosylase
MDLFSQVRTNIPEGWEELFKNATPEIKQISDILEEEKKTYRIVPDQENIFRIFYMCKPQDLKVVITGADPYFQILPNGKPRALGFSFSVSKEDAIPSSLHNIYKEIKNNYPNSIIPHHGDISHWVPQGVFLLNAGLTCRAGEPGSHVNKYKLWAPFINKFVKYMATVNKNIIWILWGKDSQKFEEMIDKSFNLILQSAHPSGLSASRGFFGCGHFKRINEDLKKMNRKPIKWLEQSLPNPNDIQKVLDNISPEDLKILTDFYSSQNDFELEVDKFCVATYFQVFANMEKIELSELYKLFQNLYEKYRNLACVMNTIKTSLHKEDSPHKQLAMIMIKINKDFLDKVIEQFKERHIDKSYNLQDFCLYMYLEGENNNKLPFIDFCKKYYECISINI